MARSTASCCRVAKASMRGDPGLLKFLLDVLGLSSTSLVSGGFRGLNHRKTMGKP